MLEPTTGRYVTKPTVGRIVHYRETGGPEPLCRAALVTFVHPDGEVALGVFGADTVYGGRRRVREGDEPGTWHWPERET